MKQNRFKYSFFLLISLFVGIHAAKTRPLEAVEDSRVPLSGGEISLSQDNLGAKWPGLSLADKRLLVPYLIEYGSEAAGAGRRGEIQNLLDSERDAFLQAGARIATVYFATGEAATRIQGLQRVARLSATARNLAAFFTAVESGRLDQNVPAERFAGICKYASQRRLCELAKLNQIVEAAAGWPSFSTNRLYEVMGPGRPFLGRNPWRPPFYSEVAGRIPERLFAVGMPLEAAILAERMTGGVSTPTARQRAIRARIPYYLAAAADFDSAVRFSDRLSGDGVLRNARLDWLILAGRYREALNYITKAGAANLANRSYAGDQDYWSGFSTSREELQLRSAMLLYLAGDVKKSAEALERLTGISGRTSTNEPAGQYARLRLAQILLRENPALAHKLAEDVTYIAQANEWHVLEYRATVIDGWAYIYMNQPYRGVINFIKARGILPVHLKQHGAEYSRLLGLLTARNRMNARGNYSELIKAINQLLQRRPYNEAIFAIREWAPREAGPDAFLLEAVRNYNLRGKRWDALNLLIEYSYTDQYFFRTGENPGGYRGFLTSAMWSQELTEFAYFERSPMRGLALSPATMKSARELLPKTGERNLSPRALDRHQYYVFSFPVEGGRYVYMIYPGNRGPGIDYVFLKTEVEHNLRQACTFANAAQNQAGCAAFTNEFESLRKKAGNGAKRTLYVHYNPEFDPDYSSLIFAASAPAETIHFYHPRVLPAPGAQAAGRIGEARVYRSDACAPALDFSGSLAVSDLDGRFSEGRSMNGVWLWPQGLDSRITKSGNVRPVYLRKFICGQSRLRLWDMDRFGQSETAQAASPDLIVYRRRAGDAGLDRAFARYFADRGSALLEFQASPRGEEGTRGVLEDIQSGSAKNIVPLFRKGNGATGPGALRLILPGIPG
ncbi:MAG: hypothetical protein RIF32_16755 [Leptospirales bacterium]|jgi:tetratricopeptide (TPR) repeat protein